MNVKRNIPPESLFTVCKIIKNDGRNKLKPDVLETLNILK